MVRAMKCWFCDEEARGTCAACGRGLCRAHANVHDEMTLAKADTSSDWQPSRPGKAAAYRQTRKAATARPLAPQPGCGGAASGKTAGGRGRA